MAISRLEHCWIPVTQHFNRSTFPRNHRLSLDLSSLKSLVVESSSVLGTPCGLGRRFRREVESSHRSLMTPEDSAAVEQNEPVNVVLDQRRWRVGNRLQG
jgi:hypothetical protein